MQHCLLSDCRRTTPPSVDACVRGEAASMLTKSVQQQIVDGCVVVVRIVVQCLVTCSSQTQSLTSVLFG